MVIRRLALHNFGVYAGDNEFVWKKRRGKVTLIGGMNGRGKTTFLEAVLLALYGSNSFAVTESNYRSYGEYLRAHINTADGTDECRVTLDFDMKEENDSNSYAVTRSWSGSKAKIYDKVTVLKNGVYDGFLTQNWTMFIESVLPSALANFFFFDGEKISELAQGETSPQMKSSIKALLGINVLDALDSDLSKIEKKLCGEAPEGYDAARLEELRGIKEEKEAMLSAVDGEIAAAEKKLEETNKKLEKKRKEFEAKGGNIVSQSRELFAERGNLIGKAEQIRLSFTELAAAELPLALVRPLIHNISEQAALENESRALQTAAGKIGDLYQQFRSLGGSDGRDIPEFIEFIRSETDRAKTDTVFGLSEHGYIRAKMLDTSQLEAAVLDYKKAKQSLSAVESRLDEIDNYLAVDIDEKAIARIYKRICELENEQTELEVMLGAKKKERASANGECIRAAADFNRAVDSALRVAERGDDRERLVKYIRMAGRAAQKYKAELQKAKADELSAQMTRCCNLLFGKRNFIRSVSVDHQTLDCVYLDKHGNEIPKNTLSAGEKQLMVISMLWALAECSRRRLPVIIDTPLARLDSKHRETLINKYFPNASAQTVILSTDSEIDKNYYSKLKKYVGNEFTLIYDDGTGASVIEDGYFKGVIG